MRETLDDKIRMAMSGDVDVLARMIRERHPGIVDALLNNPKLPLELVIQLVRKKSVTESHIHAIATHREWCKDYMLKLELILNPVTPRGTSLKLMRDMRLRDLAVISRRVSLHPMLREVAVNFLRTRMESMRTGEKINLARSGPIPFLHQLMEEPDKRILDAALSNYRLREDDVVQFITPMHRSSAKLEAVLNHRKWGVNPKILQQLAGHPQVGYAARQAVFRNVSIPLLLELTDSPALDENHRKLAVFILKQRLSEFSLEDQVHTAGSPSARMLFFIGSVMKAPAVVRCWLRNPSVTLELCDKVGEINPESEVRSWIINRRVPEGPEPAGAESEK